MRKDERVFYKKNKLQQLRGFCMTMEEGTIAKAAAKMLTAESNVSLQISSLEEELKLELFIREKKRLTPTEDAWKIYAAARHHVTGIDEVYTETAKIISDGNNKVIRIAAHFYALSHLLPESLAKLLGQNRGSEFKLYNVLRDEAIRMLKRGEVDIICFPLDTYEESLIVEDIYLCKAALAMCKGHPLESIPDKDLTWEEIRKYKFGHIGKGVTMQGLMSNIKRWKLKCEIIMEGCNWEIGKGLVKVGLCMGFLEMRYFSDSDKNDLTIKDVSHLLPDYSFQIATRNKENKDITMQFIKLLRANLLSKSRCV